MGLGHGIETFSCSEAVTVVVQPRERFSNAVAALQCLIQNTDSLRSPFSLIYVDAGSPQHVSKKIQQIASKYDWTLLRVPFFLTQHEAKNLALAHIRTRYAVFIDNDVMVPEGWLEKLFKCCLDTGAWAVLPLYLEGGWDEARNRPDGKLTTIHMGGGHCYTELDEETHKLVFRQKHWLFGTPARKSTLAKLKRSRSELVEYHAVLVDLDKVLPRIGQFDETLVSAHDHVDFSLEINAAGGSIWVEPAVQVYYRTPPPLHFSDLPFFLVRWSDAWIDASCTAFARKWGVNLRLHHASWHRSQRLYAFPSCPFLFSLIASSVASFCHWLLYDLVSEQRRAYLRLLSQASDDETQAKQSGNQEWAETRFKDTIGRAEADTMWQEVHARMMMRALPMTELLSNGLTGWKVQGGVRVVDNACVRALTDCGNPRLKGSLEQGSDGGSGTDSAASCECGASVAPGASCRCCQGPMELGVQGPASAWCLHSTLPVTCPASLPW